MPMWRLCGGSVTTERRSIAMSPSVGVSNPAIIISVVVLPDPLGPSSVRNSPAPTVSEMPRTAPTASNRFSTAVRTTVAPCASWSPARNGAVDGGIHSSGQDPFVPARDHGVAIVHPPVIIERHQPRL